ncbi:hypothetical protein QOZ80_3BG0279370 [Eleusine coracana subsp. coracana]|nr:hypothetical protein QOZ80_3BG0279370 [Eleusine coracana subsp. coracana]
MEVARAIGSLPVANVQALAETWKAADDQVPDDRYLVKESSSEEVISGDDSISAIPNIDFGKLCDPRSSSEECAKLGSACQNWGFFQLINHGVPNEVTGNLTKDVAEFFKQPLSHSKPRRRTSNYLAALKATARASLCLRIRNWTGPM